MSSAIIMNGTASNEVAKLPQAAPQYLAKELDVWTIFNQAAAKSGAVNLGQGFMNFPAPDFIKEAGRQCVSDDACNQYSPPRGRPRLLNAVARRYSQILGRELDPNTNIAVSAGANEGLFSVFTAFLDQNVSATAANEVILMEPAFDQYTPNITMAGGKPVYVPLRIRSAGDPAQVSISSKDWKLDIAELESKITSNTKIIVLNTPHNPLGKVFDQQELEAIAEVAKKYNLLVISDEVYENLCLDPDNQHLSIATLPGMWERTLTVFSAGKLFGITGWRVGWVIGPQELVRSTVAAHTRIVFTTNSPLQEAVAISLEEAESNTFLIDQKAVYERCRAKLMKAFDDVGLPYVCPDGSYFLMVNAAKIKFPADFEFPDYIRQRGRSFKLTYFFTTHIGVSGIPPTEFYTAEDAHIAEDYVRFAFSKTDDILDEAARRLQSVKKYIQ